jgi:mucin-19
MFKNSCFIPGIMKTITKKKQFVLLFFTFHFSLFTLLAQNVAINTTGSPANPSAMLDVSSTTSGFLPPRMTSTQMNAISSPATGLQVFNTTTNCLMMFTGSFWQTIVCNCATLPPAPDTITQSPAGPLCQGQSSISYSVNPVSGVTSYNWILPSGFVITSGLGTNAIYVNLLGNAVSGNAYVTATNATGPCTGPSSPALPVTVNLTPAAPGNISGSTAICANSTTNIYSIAPVAGATSYTWSVPTDIGTSFTGQGTTSITVTAASSASTDNITVTATNSAGPCTSLSSPVLSVSIVTGAPATPGAIGGYSGVQTGSTGNVYSISPVASASGYKWSVTPAGATITAGQGTTGITVNFGSAPATYSICVYDSNGCGKSSAACLQATTSTCPLHGLATFIYTGSSQTFTVPCGVTSVTYLVVAGGGSGGDGNAPGGAGGAGGVVAGTLAVSGTYTVTVGAGGIASIYQNCNCSGANGQNSVFGNITAVGGGGGGGYTNCNGASGGSGGGGAGPSCGTGNHTGGSSTQTSPSGGTGYGNAGANWVSGGNWGIGGGGGGAGGAGGNPAGGAGISSSISGSPVTYGQGGNGGPENISGAPAGNGANGAANTGNGGGGSSDGFCGSGGSGIVIIKY